MCITRLVLTATFSVMALGVGAQEIVVPDDSTAMSASLGEVVVQGNSRGNYQSGSAVEKRELINVIGLKKMACCTLAESFENSATVSVGYSDAVSGTRQIKMLGLAGTYTQFLDESRPTMRGLSAGYALNYTPGDWLQSIQVSKGVTSVTIGHDAITGQINLEYRKPTDDERLHINLYFDDMLRPEVNLTSALHFNEDKSLSTIIMAHGSIDTDWREMGSMDRNHDGFRDMPRTRQVDVANRWLWITSGGMQLRWGGRFTAEQRVGGQLHGDNPYESRADNRAANAYLKIALPLHRMVADSEGGEWQDNIALVADYDHFNTCSHAGLRQYSAHENAVSVNLRLDHYFAPHSQLAVGLQGRLTFMRGKLVQLIDEHIDEREIGGYAEWNVTLRDRLTLVTGLRGDYNDWARRWSLTPRAHLKWDITPRTTLRTSVGLGYRTPRTVIENMGLLMGTNYGVIDRTQRRVERALTAGGSMTQTFVLGRDRNASVSLDFFHTHFYRSLLATIEPLGQTVLLLSSTATNYTSTWQFDFNWTPVERLDVLATMRYTHSRIALPMVDDGIDPSRTDWLGNVATHTVERALVGRFKALLNLQYATRFRIWVFDLTGQLNGPMRIPGTGLNTLGTYHSPTYGQLFAQVTHKIGRAEVYVGCENITGYRQKEVIISAEDPFAPSFNSANVWGPLMDRKFYIGMRWNLY